MALFSSGVGHFVHCSIPGWRRTRVRSRKCCLTSNR
jgi:hypothetical protein